MSNEVDAIGHSPIPTPHSPVALFGLLNIDKPTGVTSRWVVDQVQWLVHPVKVGHAGTLDPLATGVLIVCLGPATRLIDYIHQMPKRYLAEFLLGRSSDTDDVDSLVTELANPPVPTPDELRSAASRLVGDILQRPPAYSAVKVAGRRAYKLARKGEVVELEPRPVSIHQLDVIEYQYPRLVVDLRCSSGTYVRAVGRDLAESLGTAAVMSALRRTEIGGFHAREAVHVEVLTRENLTEHVLPPLRAVENLPAISLEPQEQQLIARGQFIARPQLSTDTPALDLAALDGQGNLVAILRRRADGSLGPLRNLVGG